LAGRPLNGLQPRAEVVVAAPELIMATHGTLSGERWRELPAAGVRRIQLTDTIPDVSAKAGEAIEVLSIAPLLLEALRTRPGLGS
jgi:phosphoribosylpyrophosphate synthetase